MLKENLDSKIESFDGEGGNSNKAQTFHRGAENTNPAISAEEMLDFFKRLNQCEEKAALLSSIDPYAVHFILKSRSIPIITDLYEPNNLDLNYPELLSKCSEVEVNISEKEIEMASRTQELMRRGQEFLVS